ncbi:MAG: hypothetical protein PT939_05035 [Aerococcus suis]|nr:hypothetical protein [Aerococcus suis]
MVKVFEDAVLLAMEELGYPMKSVARFMGMSELAFKQALEEERFTEEQAGQLRAVLGWTYDKDQKVQQRKDKKRIVKRVDHLKVLRNLYRMSGKYEVATLLSIKPEELRDYETDKKIFNLRQYLTIEQTHPIKLSNFVRKRKEEKWIENTIRFERRKGHYGIVRVEKHRSGVKPKKYENGLVKCWDGSPE